MSSTILDQLHSFDDSLSNLLTRIVQTHMLGLYSICILWNAQWSDRFASSLHGNDTKQIVSLQVNQTMEFEVDLRFGMELNYCQGFIISQEDVDVFLETYQLLSRTIQRRFPRYKFVFVMEKLENGLEKYSSYSVFEDSPDVLFIEKTKRSSFHLWTTKFTGPSDHQALILLDTFDGNSGSFEKQADLFPDKLNDLMGRSLILGAFTYKPYIIVHEPNFQQKSNIHTLEGSTTNGTYLDGTEGRLVLFFCKIYNCSLNVLVDDDDEWGAVQENYTGTGLLGHLASRKVEIIICALYLWYPEYLYYHYSTVVSRTGVTLVVPMPKRMVSWFLPLQPFSSALWAAILCAFTTISITLGISYVVASSKGYHKLILGVTTTFRICLSQPIRALPTTLSGSVFMFCCLIIGFIITNIYGSGLSSFLTFPNYEEALDTKEQLAQRQQPWGATSDAWILIIELSDEPVIKTIVENFESLPENDLFEKGRTGRYAFSVERLPYGHYAAGDYITVDAMEFLQPMLEDIYYQYCVLMSFKTWPLMEHFNDFILKVQQSGIQDVLEQDVVTRYSNLQVQLELAIKRQNANEHKPRALDVEDVLGIIMIWIIGIILSMIAFSVEHLKWKLEKSKRHSAPMN